MGYTTEFNGSIKLDKPLSKEQAIYINKFSSTRRMARSIDKIPVNEDSTHVKVGLPLGYDGEFYVDGGGFMGQNDEESIIDFNNPPKTQPSLWCQWVVDEENPTEIFWDGGEKFYYYVEWMRYIIDNFIKPWGYIANGEIKWQGEDSSDMGKLIVIDNEVSSKIAKITYEY